MTTTIAIALFPDAEELDWAGPLGGPQGLATPVRRRRVGVHRRRQLTSRSPAPRGSRVLARPHLGRRFPLPSTSSSIPAAAGPAPSSATRPSARRLRSMAESGTLMTSVCTGSLVFADAGLLDWPAGDHPLGVAGSPRPRSAPTWRCAPTTASSTPATSITAAGVSAGIDMALHLVARLHSPERAREVRRYIQYDPEPPV